ncbi:MAG: hypothetical protein ABWZ76_08495 [Acidimicrobiales bacterium]
MGDLVGGSRAAEADASVAAFSGARDLMERARSDAREILADADRQARAREQEAEMLLAKARRVLVAAEEKAALIVATARTGGASDLIDLTEGDDEEPVLGRVIAPDGNRMPRGPLPARLDRMLASAFAHAVDDAFPVDPAG